MACLFVILVVSSLVMNILDTALLDFAKTRNRIQYEQANYWANAGVNHAAAELLANSTWRGTVTDGTLPPSSNPAGYSATAVDDGSGGVEITSTGYSGLGTRTLEAVITF